MCALCYKVCVCGSQCVCVWTRILARSVALRALFFFVYKSAIMKSKKADAEQYAEANSNVSLTGASPNGTFPCAEVPRALLGASRHPVPLSGPQDSAGQPWQ